MRPLRESRNREVGDAEVGSAVKARNLGEAVVEVAVMERRAEIVVDVDVAKEKVEEGEPSAMLLPNSPKSPSAVPRKLTGLRQLAALDQFIR